MNVIGKLKEIFGAEERDEFEDDELYSNDRDGDFTEDEQPTRGSRRERSAADERKVVNINATAQLKVVLIRPESYSRDANPIADHLKAKRAVVINFERTVNGEARRLLDFLSGVAYAQDGSVQRIAEKAFLITPYNVEIESNDFLYEIENGLN